MTSYKQAQEIVESRHPKGWGRVLELHMKKDKGGLGFVEGRRAPVTIPPKVQGVPVPIKFISGSIIHEEAHTVSDEGDNDWDMDNWIRPTVPGQEPSNWFFEDIITVTHHQE